MHRCIEKEEGWEGMGVKGCELPISLCDIEMQFGRAPLSTVVLLLCDQRYGHIEKLDRIPGWRRGVNAG